MRKLYGKSTFAFYLEGEFYNIPIWLINNVFDSGDDDLDIQMFKDLPLEDKKEIQDSIFEDLNLTEDDVSIERIMSQAQMDYAFCKRFEDDYLVFPIDTELSIISTKKLSEIYQKDELVSIQLFFKGTDAERLAQCETFKANFISLSSKEAWIAFEDKASKDYHMQIEKDKKYYGDDYS